MTEKLKDLKLKALAYFQGHELSSDDESLISLFISAIKSSNLLILSKIEAQPIEWQAYKYLHSEFFKDAQLYTLLPRATRWTFNPQVYLKGMELNMLLWNNANLPHYVLGFIEQDQKFFRYLALSHAFKSLVRFVPFFPTDKPMDTPFLSTLYEIEIQNGREIQTQIALLKNMPVKSLTIPEKERIVREERDFVERFLCNFLEYLIG